MRVGITQKGSFKRTEKILKKSLGRNYMKTLDKYGQRGVSALSAATPMDSGTTASCWEYEIKTDEQAGTVSIVWNNYNIQKGINIAVILQYGHATGGGGWVEGRDYINPALRPIFDQLADEAWKEVSKI